MWTYMTCIPGAPGAPGRNGAKGDLGSPRKTGTQGPRGADGKKGTKGEPGIQGSAGKKGERGDKGFDLHVMSVKYKREYYKKLEIVKFVHFSLRMNPGNVNATRNLSLKGNLGKYFDIGCFGSRHQIWNQYPMLTCSLFLRSRQFDLEPLILFKGAQLTTAFLIFSRFLALLIFPPNKIELALTHTC